MTKLIIFNVKKNDLIPNIEKYNICLQPAFPVLFILILLSISYIK